MRRASLPISGAILSGLLGLACVSASAWAVGYVVKRGDTFIRIARKELGRPVFGKNGNLAKLKRLNPGIKNFDLIFPGQEIALSTPWLAENEPDSSAEIASRAPASQLEPKAAAPKQPVDGRAPTATGLVAPIEEDTTYTQLELAPRFFFTRLETTERDNGSHARLLSKVSYGLNLKLNQVWSETFQTFVDVGVDQIKLTTATSKTLTGDSQSYSSMGAGVRFEPWSPSTRVTVRAGASEEIFYHSVSATTVSIDSVFVPRLDLGLEQEFYRRGKVATGFSGTLSVLTPSSNDAYSVNAGYAYQGKLYVRQASPKSPFSLESAIYYGQTRQNTSDLSGTRTDLGVGFGLGWSFGR